MYVTTTEQQGKEFSMLNPRFPNTPPGVVQYRRLIIRWEIATPGPCM